MWKIIGFKDGQVLIESLYKEQDEERESKLISYTNPSSNIKMDKKFYNLYLNRVEDCEEKFFVDLTKDITEEDVADVYYIGQVVRNLPTHYFIKLINNPHIQVLAEQPVDYLLQDLQEGTLVLLRLTSIDLERNKIRGKIIRKI